MSRRKKRERYRDHDSRRWLKHHPPRYSAPYRHMPPEAVWLGPARRAVAVWPKLRDMQRAMTAAPVYFVGKHGFSAEEALIHALPPGAQRQYDAVEAALRDVARAEDGQARRRLCRAVCLEHTAGVVTAAREAGISETTARRWVKRFYRAVAYHLGFDGRGAA